MTYKIIRMHCPVDVDAERLHMLKAVAGPVTVALLAGVGEKTFFIVSVHLVTVITAVFADVGRGSRRRILHVFLSVYVSREVEKVLEAGRRTTWSTLGP